MIGDTTSYTLLKSVLSIVLEVLASVIKLEKDR